MYVLFVRSDNERFLVDNSKWGMVNEIGGISMPPLEINTINKIGDAGAILSDKRVGTRDISFELVGRKGKRSELRNEALNFFNPDFSYTIYMSYLAGVTRQISCELYNVAMPAKSVRDMVTINVTFLALDPYFKSGDVNTIFLGYVVGMFGFPYVSPVGKGFTTGVINEQRNIAVNNDGNMKAPFSVEMKFNGAVKNPTLMVNEKPFKVLLDFAVSDVLYVSFETMPPKITKNGVNCIQYLSRDTDFISMVFNRGLNSVSYTADSGMENITATIKYFKRYLGVV